MARSGKPLDLTRLAPRSEKRNLPSALTEGPGFEGMQYGGAFLYVGRVAGAAQRPLEIAGMVVTAPLAGGMGMAGEGINALNLGRTFYRGMDAVEAADFAANGILRRSPNGNMGKYLTNSAAAAEAWAGTFGSTPGAVARVIVPADATSAIEFIGRKDGIGMAWYAPMEALKNARVSIVRVINLTPK